MPVFCTPYAQKSPDRGAKRPSTAPRLPKFSPIGVQNAPPLHPFPPLCRATGGWGLRRLREFLPGELLLDGAGEEEFVQLDLVYP